MKLPSLAAFFGSALASQAAIIAYNENGGTHVSAWGTTGNLVGNGFNGTNFSSITAAQFFGVSNGELRFIGPRGSALHFHLGPNASGNNPYTMDGSSPILRGGSFALANLPVKNSFWLGTTRDVSIYINGTNGTAAYLSSAYAPGLGGGL